jgi:hypothetical protein
MTELHAGLQLFRDQLRDAVARDLEPARRPRRWAVRAAVPVAATAAAAAFVVVITGGAPAPSADAAIMRHVATALTPPPAMILHERALVTVGSSTSPYEVWIDSTPPHRYRVMKWGHEGTGSGRGTPDPAAALRSLVASGNARVDAATTFDGVPAYKLTVAGASDRWLNGTAYVSRGDYHPLEIEANGERVVFQTYEYVPDSAANQRLLAP